MSLLILVLVTALGSLAMGEQRICRDVFVEDIEAREIQAYYAQMAGPLAEMGWQKHAIAELIPETRTILTDLRDTEGKLEAYRKLGFEISRDRFRGPTWAEFLRHFSRTMDALGIPETERIYPAIVLIKRKPNSESNDFLFITPGRDPWPTQSGYRIYDLTRDAFNLPPSATMKAMRAGRFPLLAHHDIGHFVGFVQNPSYMRAIRRTFARLGAIPRGSSFFFRMAVLIETLSLGNPRSAPEMKTLFKTPGVRSGAKFVRIQEFMETMKRMDVEALLDHASAVSSRFDSLTIDYGGTHARIFERDGRAYMLKYGVERAGLTASAIANRHLGERPTQSIYSEMVIATHGAELKTLVQGYRNWPQDSLELNRVLAQRLGNEWQAEVGHEGYTVQNGKEFILEILREELARAEFFLWNSSQISIDAWVSTMLSPGAINLDSPVALVLRESLGADSPQYRRLVGDRP